MYEYKYQALYTITQKRNIEKQSEQTPHITGLNLEHLEIRLLMCFQSLSDPRFSFLNSYKLNLEERHLACGFKCIPRN